MAQDMELFRHRDTEQRHEAILKCKTRKMKMLISKTENPIAEHSRQQLYDIPFSVGGSTWNVLSSILKHVPKGWTSMKL